MSLFRTNHESQPCEYLPDAWDARLHDALFHPAKCEKRRLQGYKFEFPLAVCEAEICPPPQATGYVYKSQFKIWLSDQEFTAVLVDLAIVEPLLPKTREDFPLGFADFGWEWPGHRRIPQLRVRLMERDALSERINELYHRSKSAGEQVVLVSLNLDLHQLASVDREQCWGDWREFESEGRTSEPCNWPGRLSVRVMDFRLHGKC